MRADELRGKVKVSKMNALVAGIDLGDRESLATVLSPVGDVTDRFTFLMNEEGYAYFASRVPKDARVAFESTIRAHPISRGLTMHGYGDITDHHFSAPGRVDVSVRSQQLLTWIALLSGKGVALSIDDIRAEKAAENNIRLRSDFDVTLSAHTRVIEGIRFLSPEILVVRGIIRENPSIEDVLAILIACRKGLEWKKLLELADAYQAIRFLGCILEVLNFESGKPLFEKNSISKMLRQSNLDARPDFPLSMKSLPPEKRYEEIASKWNLKLHLSHAVVSKVLTDVVR